MTTLAITPNWKNKSAKFKGTVAAGEHVSVTIQNDDGEGGEFIADASTLRLRVVNPCNGRTLAIFPEPVPEGETPETWDSDLSPLRCTLNLNTVQMLKAIPPAANVPLLWVLDDYDNNTLYFKEQFPVEHWPRLRGEEEPTDLDNYKDIIADFNTRLDGYDTRITGAENAARAATANASAAAAKANQAEGIANQAVDKAETAQNSAAASAAAAYNSALAAEEAKEAAKSAAESINSPDATLTEEGVAADAKAAGEAIAAEKERAETAEAAEETRAKGVESGLRTDLTAAQEAIDDEAILRVAADADLNANKADKVSTYTKTEVDAKVSGFVDGAEYDSDAKKILLKHGTTTVAEVDATDFIKDGMVSSVEIEDGNLVITFNTDAGQEPITIPLTDIFDPDNYYDKGAVDDLLDDKQDALTFDNAPTSGSNNPVKSGGIWSAIWGALSALPTGFSSLYDWCVSQLAAKLDANNGTMTGTFRLKGVLKVDTGDTTTYELDYYGVRVHVDGGTRQIYWPNEASLADGGYMALVENLAPRFSTSATYYKDDLVKYNGALYICIATSHTGAWSASDFAVATIQDALALKLGHEGPWVNGYIDVLERATGESVPYGVRIYRDKIVFGAFTNTVPRGFTPIREFTLPSAGGTLALTADIAGKADKANPSATGNLAALDADGNLEDSGKKPSDFQSALSAAQLEVRVAQLEALIQTYDQPVQTVANVSYEEPMLTTVAGYDSSSHTMIL